MNLLSALYSECYHDCGKTAECKEFERNFKSDEDFYLALVNTIDAESYEAFKAGFKTAVQLLVGGDSNE